MGCLSVPEGIVTSLITHSMSSRLTGLSGSPQAASHTSVSLLGGQLLMSGGWAKRECGLPVWLPAQVPNNSPTVAPIGDPLPEAAIVGKQGIFKNEKCKSEDTGHIHRLLCVHTTPSPHHLQSNESKELLASHWKYFCWFCGFGS